MILAAPLLIPFAEAAGIAIGTLAGIAGLEKLSNKVEEYIEDNPENAQKIFAMIMPEQGLANILKNESDDGEDITEVEVETPKLSGKEKGMRIKEAIRRARAGRGNYSSPDAEGPAVDIRGSVIREVEDMGIADKDLKDNYNPNKKKFNYKKYFRKAEGGIVNLATGGTPYDSRATTQDFTSALKNVSAGTTYQQQADAKKYARNEAEQELRAAIQGGGLDSFLGGSGLSNYRSMFTNDRAGTNRQGAFTGSYNLQKDQLLDALAQKKLQYTSYAPPPPKTYRAYSPEAQALNMDQSTYENIISMGADPRQYYMDYNNRTMTEGQDYGTPGTSNYTGPALLKYGQVIGGPGGMMGLGRSTQNTSPPTQAQINAQMQQMQNNPQGFQDFDEVVKYYGSNDPYMSQQQEILDMVNGVDTGYMSGQDYYDINVLGLDGQGIAEKYGIAYANGGMAGNKTYHQVRDQFMPMDSESMGYANGGGIGSMMKPKKKRVSFRGGGMDMGNASNQAQSASMGNSSSSSNDGPRGPAELGLTTRAPPGPPSGNDEKTTIIQKIKNNPIINNPLTRVLGRVGLYSVNPALMGLDYRTAMQLKGVYDTATEEVDEEDLKFQNGGSVGVGSMFVRKR